MEDQASPSVAPTKNAPSGAFFLEKVCGKSVAFAAKNAQQHQQILEHVDQV